MKLDPLLNCQCPPETVTLGLLSPSHKERMVSGFFFFQYFLYEGAAVELQKHVWFWNLAIHGLADLINSSEVQFLIIKMRADGSTRLLFCL